MCAGGPWSAHALVLCLFYLVGRVLPLLGAGPAGSTEGGTQALVFAVSIDLLLMLGLCGALAVPAKRNSRLALLPLVALYVLLVAEFQFQRQTGSFFSLHLLRYAIAQLRDLWPVLRSSGIDLWLFALGATAAYALLLPLLATPRVLRWLAAPALLGSLMLAALAALASGVLTERTSLALSLFVAVAGVGVPQESGTVIAPEYPYRAPVLRAPASHRPPDVLVVILESARARSIPGFPAQGDQARMPVLMALQAGAQSFDAAYTTTSHTSKALIGILCGVEPRPVMRIAEADPAGLPVSCLPKLMSQLGYHSLFLQSATADFEQRPALVRNMGFDAALFREQIDRGYRHAGYFAVDERALVKPFRTWWTAQAQSPRLAVVLTSSTHHPYQVPGEALPRGPVQEERAYRHNLERSDAVLGELLREVGPAAVVIVTGDHGQAFGEHGRYQHDAVPYEEVLRVPLVLRLPGGQNTGSRDTALRTHLDILPTLLELSAATWDGVLPGRSLLGVEGHAQLFTRCWWAASCATRITPADKWIEFPLTAGAVRFDLRRDPQERNNLLAQVSGPDRESVRREIAQHAASLNQFYLRRGPAAPARPASPD